MKKEKYRISWLLLIVSIIMLVASVFPHHHHLGTLCLQPDTEQCDVPLGHTSSPPSSQSTDCKACCVTKFQCAMPDHQWTVHLGPIYTFETLLFIVSAFSTLPGHVESNNIYSSFHLEKLHSIHLSRALGLRAPPFA